MLLPEVHIAGNRPDWEQVAPEERNGYQERAAETGGWDTPGNRETLKGAIISGVGLTLLKHDTALSTIAGTVVLGFGRSKDLKDGKVADATGTKSQLGEKIDSGTDTVLLGALDKILVEQGTLSRTEARLALGCAAVKVAAAGIAAQRDKELHPNRLGKYPMFGQWVARQAYSASRAAHHLGAVNSERRLRSIAHGLNYMSLGVSIVASGRYLGQSLKSS